MATRSQSSKNYLNDENARPVKQVGKKVQGPMVRRGVLGDIGNRKNIAGASTAGQKNAQIQSFKKPATKCGPFAKKTISKADAEACKPAEPVEVSMASICVPEDMSVTEEQKLSPERPQTTLVEVQSSPEGITVDEEDQDIKELSDAFSSKMLTVADIDDEDYDNPQLVAEYVNDIYIYMRDIEGPFLVKKRYLDGRTVTARMRAILIDWLVQVHHKFSLMQETLYLTACIVDRYLQGEPDTPKDKLQLVGVTAMFIAGKYEEMYCTEIGDYVYITDNAYSKLQIREMEVKILKSLNFYISFPLPLHFLRRNSKAGMVDATQHMLAKYLMELSLPDYNMCHYRASQIGAAALMLTIRVIGDGEWTDTLAHYSGYTESEILPIVCRMALCVKRSQTSKQQAIPRKYMSAKLGKISEIPELRGDVIRSLSERAMT